MEKNQQAWFDVTSDVEAWFDGSAANNGLLVRTLATTDGWEFGSGGNADVNRRPDLRVTYTVDPLVIRQDCLCYFMESMGLPGAAGPIPLKFI